MSCVLVVTENRHLGYCDLPVSRGLRRHSVLFFSVCPDGSLKETFRLSLAGMGTVMTLRACSLVLRHGASASTWLVSGGK